MTQLKRAVKLGSKFQNPVPTTVGSPSMIFKLLPMYLTNKEERVPKVPLGPFRTDPHIYKQVPESGLRVTWFGHSSLLVEIDGVRVLVDPVWDKRASPVQWSGPKRFFAPTLQLEDLPELDAVLMSHDHFDHFGAGTVRRLSSQRPRLRWIAPLAVGAELRKHAVAADRITELDWTESTVVHGPDATLTVTALPARHFSGRSLFNRFETLWASYALKGTQHAMYCGADSGEWEGFAEIGATYGPFDLTALEIGAFHPLWANIHMGPDGAARSFLNMGGTGLLMPIHWALFDLALHGWRQPIERLTEVAALRGIPLWSPTPGEPTEVVAGKQLRAEWWRKA